MDGHWAGQLFDIIPADYTTASPPSDTNWTRVINRSRVYVNSRMDCLSGCEYVKHSVIAPVRPVRSKRNAMSVLPVMFPATER